MLAAGLLALALVVPQEGATFASRSGEKRLEVEDSHDGAFVLRLFAPGGAQWTEEVRHSVDKAYVCESGAVVAHGVTHVEGARQDQGFVLTILGPEDLTRTRMLEVHPLVGTIDHAGPYPSVRGMFVWETLDVCAFWISDLAKPAQLWTYRISDGTRLGVIEPERRIAEAHGGEPRFHRLTHVVAEEANGLLLCTFWVRGPVQGEPGPGNYVGPDLNGMVALLSTKGELLWSQALPSERFCGEIRDIQAVPNDLRCKLEVNRLESERFGRKKAVHVEDLELHFRRDAAGVWSMAKE